MAMDYTNTKPELEVKVNHLDGFKTLSFEFKDHHIDTDCYNNSGHCISHISVFDVDKKAIEGIINQLKNEIDMWPNS